MIVSACFVNFEQEVVVVVLVVSMLRIRTWIERMSKKGRH